MERFGGRASRRLPAAALLVLASAIVPAGAQVKVTDTTMSLQPSNGSASTTFTATLTYSPQQAACPPSTQVDFTWDGARLGSSQMQGSVKPCRATLTTKPLAGHVVAGSHQVCGTFSFNGAHKGCAPFTIEGGASKPRPVYSTTYSTRYYTTYTTTHPRSTTTYYRSTTKSVPSSRTSPGALAPRSGGNGVATGPIVGAAMAAILLFGIRAIVWTRRHASYRR
jgi:hypothetical protein